MNFENTKKNPSETSSIKSTHSKDSGLEDAHPKEIKTAVNRFVGEGSQTYQSFLEDDFSYWSKNEGLASFEKEIPTELKKAIEQINKLLVTFLKDWGLEEYVAIDASNIVLADLEKDEILRKEITDKEAGTYHSSVNRIRILTDWKAGNYREFVRVLVHEMIHMQAFQSWNINSWGELDDQRRQGLRAYHSQETESFAWLDEAITEELSKRFLDKHEKDIQSLQGKNKPLVIIEKIKGWSSKNDGHSYKEQRDFLQQVITGIRINGRGKYKNRDEVFKLFTNAALNGRLLPVARAIEKARGKGSFKKLAGLDINMREKE